MSIHIERVAVFDILKGWRPGSYDTNAMGQQWGWTNEAYDIAVRECACCGNSGHYMDQMLASMRSEGEFWDHGENPITLGDDGRVWDGHHRILAAARLMWPDLPVHMGETRGD